VDADKGMHYVLHAVGLARQVPQGQLDAAHAASLARVMSNCLIRRKSLSTLQGFLPRIRLLSIEAELQ
jgi:hypothetical protein